MITDSGGGTEETTFLGVPCMTLRDTTERPETVTLGTNVLLGSDPEAVRQGVDVLLRGEWKKGQIPEKWDGRAGQRIAQELKAGFFDVWQVGSPVRTVRFPKTETNFLSNILQFSSLARGAAESRESAQ